ncbi:hypothetical protein SODALDRAFT_327456 [Sodiomyces alkalinus F11]|uniref:Required for respiratory growth protein 9, mitochondrial n=1 Tax=Sodiomyces alkalinus (strain CBS 110278 / VKM F-3762 / F11) TaxID=1314773 RepID=A0A3N2Q913_SODAK|nr:hypothetical protein SODALDRAFT_327456 [Sodiomyces alkalinus F11]ROT43269.1 hypothetical protein SODALDRAFT_327456 [Sodiomyces alkalinus F11]
MICCRTASLRLFIRNLAQIHNFDLPASPSRFIPAYSPRVALSHGRKNTFSTSVIRALEKEASGSDHTPDAAKHTTDAESGTVLSPRNPQLEISNADPNKGKQKTEKTTLDVGDTNAQARSDRDWEPSSTGPGKVKTQEERGKKQKKKKKTAKEKDAEAKPRSKSGDSTAGPQTERLEPWRVQKEALKEKFPEGWRPLKRLSPDAIAGIRALHQQFPDEYGTAQLAEKFEVSPEAIRRILRSKWTPSTEEEEERRERWFRRGMSVWSRYAELGVKPPRKWRKKGIVREPSYHERRRAAIERRRELEEADAGASLQRKLGGKIL